MKRVVLRKAAEQDIEGIYSRYLQEAGARVALQFVKALDTAFHHLHNFPGTGSPRYSELLGMPGLRSWLMRQFPYTVFYIEHDAQLVVIRLLHQQSDIPAQLQVDETN